MVAQKKENAYLNNRDLKFGFFCSRFPGRNEKMRFDPCEMRKDGLTEKTLRKLQRVHLSDELEP
jgi:hypothetical protein